MSFFKRKKEKARTFEYPSWEQVVEIMYDKQLEVYDEKTIKVIYSKDKSMRYVITQGEDKFIRYRLERLYSLEEEGEYIADQKDALPAIWEPALESQKGSVFSDESDALNQIYSEANYKKFFI